MYFILDRSTWRLRFVENATSKPAFSCSINYKYPKNKLGWKNAIPSNADETQVLHLQIANGDEDGKGKEVNDQDGHGLGQSVYSWVKPRAHLLKSNAQKAIRLAMPKTCLRTSYLILISNSHVIMQDYVKRWFIIPTEDACFSPFACYFLFYYLCMTKGYNLTAQDKYIILRCIELVSDVSAPADWRCNYKIVNDDDCSSDLHITKDSETELLNMISMTCQVKACFGGLAGDMELLYDTQQIFQERFNQTRRFPKFFAEHVKLFANTGVWLHSETLDKMDWRWQPEVDQIASATDMHCTALATYLCETSPFRESIPITRLKNLVWDRRSSLRRRQCTCGEHSHDEVKDPRNKLLIQNGDPEWWKNDIALRIHDLQAKEWTKLYLAASAPVKAHLSAHLSVKQGKKRSNEVTSTASPMLQFVVKKVPRV